MTRASKNLVFLVLGVLILQTTCHYFGVYFNTRVLGLSPFEPFRWLHFTLRNFVALGLALWVLQIPRQHLGLSLPEMSPQRWGWFVGALILVTLLVLGAQYIPGYESFYKSTVSAHHVPAMVRFKNFALFTLSTLIGWEVLHRGILLFGIVYLLYHQTKVERPTSEIVAILFVACFESLFHLSKPPIEAYGLALGSPILSMIALRTGSLLIPLVLHLYIELVFVGGMIF